MLATIQGGSEPAPDDAFRRELLDLLAALGPHLLTASRALDSPTPLAARASLRDAALLLRPYLT